jgi:hypothetical protein
LSSFGQEFGLGTFSSLLAQPLQRNRIWKTKLLLVTIAALLALLVMIVSMHLRLDSILESVTGRLANDHGNRSWNLLVQRSVILGLHSQVFWRVGLILVLVGLASGLWTTLLFRQTGAALWFAILVPGGIFACIDSFTPDSFPRQTVFSAALAIYSIAGCLWAYRMFLAAQDVQWLGGAISLSGLSSSKTQVDSASARRRKPLRALLRKEFQYQQMSLLIAFGLLVLHVCALAFRGFASLPHSSELRFTLESLPFLWFLMPWLIGSMAVAEERKLGTFENQLCMPVSRLCQFVIKFCVVFLLGVLLGAIVPWAIEAVGIGFHVPNTTIRLQFSGDAFAVMFIVFAAVITAVSFLASSLTRNTLHALGAAIALGCLFLVSYGLTMGFLAASAHSGFLQFFTLISDTLPLAIIALVIVLSYRNSRHVNIGSRLWLKNLAALALYMVLMLVALAFYWTMFLPNF